MFQDRNMVLTRSNFFVLQILLFFYIVSENFNRYDLVSFSIYISFLFTSIGYLFYLDYRESTVVFSNNQFLETVYYTTSVLIMLGITADLLLVGDSNFFSILVYLAPLHLVYAVFELIKGKEIEIDDLSEIRDYFETYGNGQIYHLIPKVANSNMSQDYSEIERASNLHFFSRRIYQKKNLDDHELREMNLLIMDKSDQYSLDLVVPNEYSLANLSNNPFVKLPTGFENLKRNTLTQLYYYRLSRYISTDNWLLKYMVDGSSLNKNEDFIMEVNLDGYSETKISIMHSWTPTEIVNITKNIVDTFVALNNTKEAARTKEQFLDIINSSNFKNMDQCKMLIFQLVCISESKTESDIRLSRFDLSLLRSYNKAAGKVLPLLEVANTKNNQTHNGNYSLNEVREIILHGLSVHRKIKSNPVKYLVQYHDIISRHISNRESSRELESYFDEIMSSMMLEISTTKNLQNLVQDGSLTVDKLSESREGIVAGSAIVMHLLNEFVDKIPEA